MVVVLTVLSLGVARAAEAPSPPEGMPAMPSMQGESVHHPAAPAVRAGYSRVSSFHDLQLPVLLQTRLSSRMP
eukprot:scaffold158226_cov36-Tisochrysis_lutea.AAC.1